MLKKWSAIILVCLLLVGGLPQLAEAAQSKQIEKDLDTYLQQISKVRGFKVTKSDIEYSLGVYEMTINDFENVTELKEFLGEVIRKDKKNLKQIYGEFKITADEMEAILHENGETLDDYVFVDNLWYSVDFYLEEKIPRDPNFDENLEIWLREISKIRGFEITRKHIEESLALYEENLGNFKTVERVSDFLGEVIEKDLGNLDWVYDMYGLNEQEFLQVLKDNNLDLNDYIFIDDLTSDLDLIIGWEDDNMEEVLAELKNDFGLTEEELDRLETHFLSIEDHLMKDENIDRLFSLAERLMAFEDFDTATEITPKQALELMSIYKEFISLFQLKVDFSLVQSGTESPISLHDLFAMDELVNADLLIKVYNLQGDFLADLLITGEMVDSETLHKVGADITNGLSQQTTVNKDFSTVKGAKLPNTAGNFVEKSVGWLLASLFGAVLFLRMRKASSEK